MATQVLCQAIFFVNGNVKKNLIYNYVRFFFQMSFSD